MSKQLATSGHRRVRKAQRRQLKDRAAAELESVPGHSDLLDTKPARSSVERGNRQRKLGFAGRGGGLWHNIPVPRAWRSTTVQVAGLWPFSGGSSRPNFGVPIGTDIETRARVCCDPITWFERGLIATPSMVIMGKPSLGKSSLVVRQIIGLADRGVLPLVLGDLKPDYVAVCRKLGCQVIQAGQGQSINVLDQRELLAAANRAEEAAEATTEEARAAKLAQTARQLRQHAYSRATNMLLSLVQVRRHGRLADWERTQLRLVAGSLMAARWAAEAEPPIVSDVVDQLRDPTVDMMQRRETDDAAEYRREMKGLLLSLESVCSDEFGDMFDHQTTERIDMGGESRGVCIDISAMGGNAADPDLLAAVLLASWDQGFAAVDAANTLADAGLAPQRHWLIVMDEMWRPMRISGAGLVDALDQVTRLNRSWGIAQIYIFHSPKDTESMESEADNQKAKGFIERSSIVCVAGLSKPDLDYLSGIHQMSVQERKTVASWSTPDGWEGGFVIDKDGRKRPKTSAGTGKILIKVGEGAGIQAQVHLTGTEKDTHDTNLRWVE